MGPKKRATFKTAYIHSLMGNVSIPTATCERTSLIDFGISRSRHVISRSTCRKTCILGSPGRAERCSQQSSTFLWSILVLRVGVFEITQRALSPELPPESTHCSLLLGTWRGDAPRAWSQPSYTSSIFQMQSSRGGVHGGAPHRT